MKNSNNKKKIIKIKQKHKINHKTKKILTKINITRNFWKSYINLAQKMIKIQILNKIIIIKNLQKNIIHIKKVVIMKNLSKINQLKNPIKEDFLQMKKVI